MTANALERLSKTANLVLESAVLFTFVVNLCGDVPVTGLALLPGRILLSIRVGNFSPVNRTEIQETKPKWWNLYRWRLS